MTEVFRKKLDVFSGEERALLLQKNQVMYDLAQQISGLIVPRPISLQGDVLFFESVSIDTNLADEWYAGRARDPDLLYAIGEKIGTLHALQGQGNIYVHGDFWLHNVGMAGDAVIFFDFEPPALHEQFDLHYRNDAYMDIATFVVGIVITHSFKKPWQFFVNYRPYVSAFLNGYRSGSGQSVHAQTLMSACWNALRSWRKWQRRVGKSRASVAIRYILAAAALWWQIRVNRICT